MAIKHQKKRFIKSIFFFAMFCLMEDLCAISNSLEFDKNFKKTYALELKLKKNILISDTSYQITTQKHSRF